jgi:hypothetical protein
MKLYNSRNSGEDLHSPRFPWYARPGTQDQAVGETSIAEAFANCETTTENVGLTALLFHETPAFPLSSRTALIQAFTVIPVQQLPGS